MSFHYRTIRAGEEEAASAVVMAAFAKHVEPGYSEQGVQEFRGYAHPDSLRARRESVPRHHMIVAVCAGTGSANEVGVPKEPEEIVGVTEVRSFCHLSMLYVHPRWHQYGIGRQLLRQALAAVRAQNPSLRELTVNSTPFAVPVYERYGFDIAGPATVVSGIQYVPMVLDLTDLTGRTGRTGRTGLTGLTGLTGDSPDDEPPGDAPHP